MFGDYIGSMPASSASEDRNSSTIFSVHTRRSPQARVAPLRSFQQIRELRQLLGLGELTFDSRAIFSGFFLSLCVLREVQ